MYVRTVTGVQLHSLNDMANPSDRTTRRGTDFEDIYLPAVALPANFDRVEGFVRRLLNRHRFVRMPVETER